MAGNLTKTKRRIASIKSTKKITKAMEMVASVKLKRFKNAHENGIDYLKELEQEMGYLCHAEKEAIAKSGKGHISHYQRENEDAKGNLYILVTSDLGLCAGYNSNLFRYFEEHFDKGKDTLAPIGNKGLTHYSREGDYQIDPFLSEIGLSVERNDVLARCDKIKKDFNRGKYKKVILVYTHYKNSISFIPTMETLLPLSIELEDKPYRVYAPELLEESPNKLLHRFLPSYLYAKIRATLVESQLSEQASRRNAMENANDNADELLNKLTIEYNKARQGAITQEITEVVSGSASSN
ncbi:MAG: ATP synthase F1 subunit gamma [Bacilli bacterium]|nr:ATP synthase F1 subunit gamma [Bacilli bacterium]